MKSFPTMTDLELEISNPCNEKCIHCYRTCKNKKKGFLSARQAESVFSQAKALGVSRVTITGGEMLLNSEWKDIVRIADSLDFRISLFSNGTRLTEKDADFISSRHILFSYFTWYKYCITQNLFKCIFS